MQSNFDQDEDEVNKFPCLKPDFSPQIPKRLDWAT